MLKHIVLATFIVTALLVGSGAHAQELQAPKNWRQEKIKLPPGFAPGMQLIGHEDIRFAPGMFKADSDSFFSYVLVFYVAPEPELTKEVLHRELLAYYRGLATAVMKGRGQEIDAEAFTLELTPQEPGTGPTTQYRGDLQWVEPFTTGKQQKLLLDIDSWNQPEQKRNIVLMCVSPKSRDAEIWKEMLAIRASFLKQ